MDGGWANKRKLLPANAVELSWSSSILNEKSSCSSNVELLMNDTGGAKDSYRSPFDWLKKLHPPPASPPTGRPRNNLARRAGECLDGRPDRRALADVGVLNPRSSPAARCPCALADTDVFDGWV